MRQMCSACLDEIKVFGHMVGELFSILEGVVQRLMDECLHLATTKLVLYAMVDSGSSARYNPELIRELVAM